MALLGAWVEEHSALPETQAQMYESYLRVRLSLSREKLSRHALSPDDVLTATTEIAWFIFTSKAYGLEAPVSAITGRRPTNNNDDDTVMDVLASERIGRISLGEDRTFAFAHRRFLEYFVTQKLVVSPSMVPLDDILTDSRGRDALVLYAEVAVPDDAGRLAEFCWSQIVSNFDNTATRIRAVHSLRFLIDAFRARKSCIAPFEDELARFVKRGVEEGQDLLVAKLCLEAIGLLREDRVEPILINAIREGNEWLQDTAFKACRHNPRVSSALSDVIEQYIWGLPITEFLIRSRNLLFSLSLSEGLTPVLNRLLKNPVL
jgi:hypothetical protein